MVLRCGILEGIGTDADIQQAIQSPTGDFQLCDMQCIDESQCSDIGQRIQIYSVNEELVSFLRKGSPCGQKRKKKGYLGNGLVLGRKGGEGSSGIKAKEGKGATWREFGVRKHSYLSGI